MLTVSAAAEKSGSCGNDLTWTLTADGTLTIKGKGKMSFFTESPWDGNDVMEAVILNGDESISDNAFSDCIHLNCITIPESVTSIGRNAVGYDINGNKYGNITIKGPSHSAAEDYANVNGFTFSSTTSMTRKNLPIAVVIAAVLTFFKQLISKMRRKNTNPDSPEKE